MFMLLTNAGNGPASKKKLKSQKKKKRKRCDEEEEEGFPTVEDICNDADDYRAEDNTGTVQKQQPTTQPTGRQHDIKISSIKLCSNTTHM